MKRFSRAQWTWTFVMVASALLLLTVGTCVVFVLVSVSINDAGSPELAGEWKAELSAYPTPEAAQASNPEVLVHRFANGEWVMGRVRDSHGRWRRGGGTAVLKDSTGAVRVFFGHVCGGYNVPWPDGKSLSEYYDQLVKYGMVEKSPK